MKSSSLALVALSSSLALAQAPAPAPAPRPTQKAAPGPAAAPPPAQRPAPGPGSAPAPAGAAPAPTTSAPAPGGLDWSKVGPMSRRPTREAAVRREIDAFVRQEDTFTAGTDVEARLARVDFPLFMVTDDAGGAPEAALTSREQYLSEMKPFWDTMPRDAKFTHKLAITVLSDSLAAVTDDYTMSVRGKRVVGARNSAVLVKRAGQWKWKSMVEAGWGGMSAPDAATAAPPPAPAPAHSAPPPVPAPHGPAPAPAPAPAPRR